MTVRYVKLFLIVGKNGIASFVWLRKERRKKQSTYASRVYIRIILKKANGARLCSTGEVLYLGPNGLLLNNSRKLSVSKALIQNKLNKHNPLLNGGKGFYFWEIPFYIMVRAFSALSAVSFTRLNITFAFVSRRSSSFEFCFERKNFYRENGSDELRLSNGVILEVGHALRKKLIARQKWQELTIVIVRQEEQCQKFIRNFFNESITSWQLYS